MTYFNSKEKYRDKTILKHHQRTREDSRYFSKTWEISNPHWASIMCGLILSLEENHDQQQDIFKLTIIVVIIMYKNLAKTSFSHFFLIFFRILAVPLPLHIPHSNRNELNYPHRHSTRSTTCTTKLPAMWSSPANHHASNVILPVPLTVDKITKVDVLHQVLINPKVNIKCVLPYFILLLKYEQRAKNLQRHCELELLGNSNY